MSIQLAVLASRLAETDLEGPPPSSSVISPAGARELVGSGSVTQKFLNDLPEPATVPKMDFNNAGGSNAPSQSLPFDFKMGGQQ